MGQLTEKMMKRSQQVLITEIIMNYIVLICNLAEDWYIQYPTAALDNIKT